MYNFFALQNLIVFNCFLAWLVFRIIIPAVLHFNKLEEQAYYSLTIWSFIVVLHFASNILNDLWFLQVDHMG